MTAVLPESPTLLPRIASPRVTEIRLAPPQVHAATLLRMTSALAGLAELPTVQQLVDSAPAALCSIGFDRAMISRLEEASWVVERFHSEIDPQGAALITEAARTTPQRLGPSIIELEMVRRRVPILVSDVSREPRVHPGLAEMTRSHSYVAAPIAPEGDVVGFLHADRLEGAPVTSFDREVVAQFAQHFGALVRTAWLRERFERMRTTVDHLRTSLGDMVTDCVSGAIGLAPEAPATQDLAATSQRPAARLAQSMLVGDPEIEDLLSTREREVLRLMALGETNTRIASKLVISEGTVKSHVRHILRKLNAANRAEAVCRWLQRPPGQG
ncbi:LuxR C-terminal-related transcriptional regulator [soil metagenome]